MDRITSNSKVAIKAVENVASTCAEAERTLNYKYQYQALSKYTPFPVSTAESLASTVCAAVLDQRDIRMILVLTETGKIARLVSKYRPEVKIMACTSN